MIDGIETYYPTGCNPIHEVKNWAYVRRIVRAARRGESIPAIVMDGENLLNGTHRMTANSLMKMLWEQRETSPKPVLIETVQFEDLDLDQETKDSIVEAMQYCNYDTVDYLLGDRDND